jgi:pimeloyl-ACP methyl ester carboxylesterase
VLWGAHDPYLPVRQAGLQKIAFPDAHVEVLRESGHWPHLDAPDLVLALVSDFLSAHTIASPDIGDTARS